MIQNVKWVPLGTAGGWRKAAENPVIGPEYGTTFDLHVIKKRVYTVCGFPGGMSS